MKGYIVKTPKVVQRMFPHRIWSLPSDNSVYLTFDDGPVKEVTPWVLDTLERYQAKATFFCIGSNIERNPDIFKQIISEGHAIGNHTFNHCKGIDISTEDYLGEVKACQKIISTHNISSAKPLFRPPYGRMKQSQAKVLIDQGYSVVMWELLSADFDTEITASQCLENVTRHIQPGSVVVFHDSVKAEPRLRHSLPAILEFISEKGWNCEKIAV